MQGPRTLRFLAFAACAPVFGATAPPLTRIEEVRDLTAEQAQLGLPVHVRGTVTWKTAWGVTIQAGDAGTWLHMNEARARKVWQGDPKVLQRAKPGDILEVDGITLPGAFAPGIMPAAIRLVGQGPAPVPRPVTPGRFFSGADDGMLVEVKGVIQGVRAGDGSWIFRLNTDPGIVTVEFPVRSLRAPENLTDAEVRVIGVATTRFNTRGEMTMPRIFSSRPEDMIVEKPASPPSEAPLLPLNRILAYHRLPFGPHRVRVAGIVTFALPGQFLYLQEGDTAVRVETNSDLPLALGDRVEVSGFPEMSRFIGGLAEAQVRKIGRGDLPAPLAIGPEEIVRLNHESLNQARRAQPHDHDGHLITFRARLLSVQTPFDSRRPARQLALKRAGDIVMAELTGPESATLDRLLPGSEIVLTGIAQLEYTSVAAQRSRLSLLPNRVSLILRGPEDVVVVSAPSWWTPPRLLAVVGLAACALGAALLWIWQLRRQVHLKTEQLALEMRARRDSAVEFQATIRERNQLAANLHDTLLQTLGGVGFEIGTCEVEAGGRAPSLLPRLAVVRRILDIAVSELRNSVWALRSNGFANLSLGETLRAILTRETSNKRIRFDLQLEHEISGLPDFVAGNLVLSAQEAIRNAVRHGEPQCIDVRLSRSGADHISLRIADDGAGFTPGEQRGPAQGHFGLVGLRERIERLEGRVTITSALGKGTTVEIEVPVRSYDRAVA